MSFLSHAATMIVPLILSNGLHMVVVKKNLFSVLNKPIWEWGFGLNKSWRGFVIVPLLNAIFLFCFHVGCEKSPSETLFLGAFLGMCYMLAELPNSFIKRRIGIASGSAIEARKWIFVLFDKTDSALGVTLGYCFLVDLRFVLGLELFLCSVITHILISIILVKLHIKSSF
jgi:CDP-diglyceride synthetase